MQWLVGWLLGMGLLLWTSVTVAGVLVLSDADAVVPLGPSLSVYADATGQTQLEIIRQLPEQVWESDLSNVPNFGYSQKGYWFQARLKVENDLPHNWLLEIAYPVLDYVQVWLIRDDRLISHWRTGDAEPFYQRPLSHRNFLFPLDLEAGSTYQVWIFVASQGTVQLPATLSTQSRYIETEQARLVPQSAYFGMLLVLLLYNAFIWFSIRERVYLYYIAYVATMLLGQMAIQGFGYQYLWPSSVWWQDVSMAVLSALFVTFVCLFTDEFLRLWLGRRRLSFLLRSLSVVAAGVAVGALFLPYAVMIRVAVSLALLAALVSFIAGLLSLHQGSVPARYFVAAWSVFLTGILLYALQKYGMLPRNLVTEYSVQLGSIFEVVVLSIALADRINHERRQRYMAQKTALEEAQQRAVAESRLLHQSLHDRLTGTPNRLLLEQSTTNIITQAVASRRMIGFLLIKFPHFQEINNTLGHQAGDGLLKLVVARLAQAVSVTPGVQLLDVESGDVLAHIEGVSFAAILSADNEDLIQARANQLAKAMRETVNYLEMSIDVPVVIGISLCPLHAQEFDSLLRCAEVAVEMAAHGEHDISVYSDRQNRYSARRLSMMGELRQALTTNELQLHYQPKFDLRDRRIVGVEALLRWPHPVHGPIPPDQFVTMAEHTGLIKPLTRWVLEQALKQLMAWRAAGIQLDMSINISAKNLREAHFCEYLLGLLRDSQALPDCLTLELTETAMMQDQDVALRVLHPIRHAGIKVSMDDFGVGYSSLAYLNRLPISELKIDKSFIFALDRQPDDTAIVRTAINMAHDLGLQVVAEGVESEIVCRRLQMLGCDLIQGYYIERPMPAEQLVNWLMRMEGNDLVPPLLARREGV
ncbi:EAL domain-containing protein [Chitinivorax sp. B]|uniref:EAL domain-containing protein n=1 Tax=Chitinivorax sp. B TaxID=2502235 RepID=UPI0014850D28|nr:EAL domain-containing protein [Chitinivorax sp. B]